LPVLAAFEWSAGVAGEVVLDGLVVVALEGLADNGAVPGPNTNATGEPGASAPGVGGDFLPPLRSGLGSRTSASADSDSVLAGGRRLWSARHDGILVSEARSFLLKHREA
jgi:hypothetical protein